MTSQFLQSARILPGSMSATIGSISIDELMPRSFSAAATALPAAATRGSHPAVGAGDMSFRGAVFVPATRSLRRGGARAHRLPGSQPGWVDDDRRVQDGKAEARTPVASERVSRGAGRGAAWPPDRRPRALSLTLRPSRRLFGPSGAPRQKGTTLSRGAPILADLSPVRRKYRTAAGGRDVGVTFATPKNSY